MNAQMNAACLETVRFRLAAGADPAAFRAAAPLVSEWAARQPGFRGRLLVDEGEGWFADLVWWESEAAAKAAASAFGPALGATAFARAIDGASVEMRHLPVVSAA